MALGPKSAAAVIAPVKIQQSQHLNAYFVLFASDLRLWYFSEISLYPSSSEWPLSGRLTLPGNGKYGRKADVERDLL